jgi:hypothetical protein
VEACSCPKDVRLPRKSTCSEENFWILRAGRIAASADPHLHGPANKAAEYSTPVEKHVPDSELP